MSEEKVMSVKDLIARKTEILGNKSAKYEVNSPIGKLLVRRPTMDDIDTALEVEKGRDAFFIAEQIIEPSFKDKELQEAYGVTTAIDLVEAIFTEGQIESLSKTIVSIGEFNERYAYNVHKELKN